MSLLSCKLVNYTKLEHYQINEMRRYVYEETDYRKDVKIGTHERIVYSVESPDPYVQQQMYDCRMTLLISGLYGSARAFYAPDVLKIFMDLFDGEIALELVILDCIEQANHSVTPEISLKRIKQCYLLTDEAYDYYCQLNDFLTIRRAHIRLNSRVAKPFTGTAHTGLVFDVRNTRAYSRQESEKH